MTRKGRILVVEDDFDIANILNIYFDGQGYLVQVAGTGAEALLKVKEQRPDLIMLDIMLPDMDGYSVCQQLRSRPETSDIPILFLTQKDERSDRISGLELGADDYITKPFDIEELKLRVQNSLRRAERERWIDARTGLPAGGLIQERLADLLSSRGWALLDLRVENLEDFQAEQGFLAADDLLRQLATMMGEVLRTEGTQDDFLGHAGSGNFIIITTRERVEVIRMQLQDRFMDIAGRLERKAESDRTPMYLAFGLVDGSDHEFEHVKDLTEAALEARRMDNAGDGHP
ncbi:MAG: response regulator [Anaerolineales bacterium]|jgi:DNA-binding response OmpR family regulator